VAYVDKLTTLRREFDRHDQPFEIMLALLETPSADLYTRAEDIGITAVMCAPWMMVPDINEANDIERYRAPIEKFAESIVAKCR
jgi:hypothetical protein